MKLIFSKKADEGLVLWKKSGNKVILKRINLLIESIIKNPFSGLGKLEKLKYKDGEIYSRRVDKKHRVVYEVFEKENKINIYSLKGHYEN